MKSFVSLKQARIWTFRGLCLKNSHTCMCPVHAGGLKRTAEVFSHVCAFNYFNKAKSYETSDQNSALIASD